MQCGAGVAKARLGERVVPFGRKVFTSANIIEQMVWEVKGVHWESAGWDLPTLTVLANVRKRRVRGNDEEQRKRGLVVESALAEAGRGQRVGDLMVASAGWEDGLSV